MKKLISDIKKDSPEAVNKSALDKNTNLNMSRFEDLKKNIVKIIKGKEQEIDLILSVFFAGGHILLEDVPGVGKTTLAKALAMSVSCDFKRIQFTPDLLPADILGGSVYNANEGSFHFRKGPVFANVVLADEINRASPRTQSSMLECMSENQITIEGTTHILKPPFIVIATQNPVDFHGTYPLPEAQMDRFAALLSLGYPQPEAELNMLLDQKESHPLENIKPVIDSLELVHLMKLSKTISVDQNIAKYIINIVNKSREDLRLDLGLSPRAAIAMVHCAQSRAMLNNRTYVTPDDVKFLVPYVFSHRLIPKRKSDKSTTIKKMIMLEILNQVKSPI